VRAAAVPAANHMHGQVVADLVDDAVSTGCGAQEDIDTLDIEYAGTERQAGTSWAPPSGRTLTKLA
jgi:hypothetical protein